MQEQQQHALFHEPSGTVDGSEDSSHEKANVSLPALAVAAVNACDSPSFLNAKARLLQEAKSGALARVKKLMPLMPITVPQRAIGTEISNSPSSGSPTPTDFSPMLLPKAEENLTALISEHNQQKMQLQVQQFQQQQFQLQVQQLQQLQLQQQVQQVQQQQQLQQASALEIQLGHVNPTDESLSEQPASKRQRVSTRGRKRHSEVGATGAQPQVGIGTLAMFGPMNGAHLPLRRSSLGSTSVSVGAEEPIADTAMRKGPWLASEDETLLQLVEKYGAHDWSFIAEHIPGRVGKQCRERYFNHLAPDVRKDAWTDREDDAIVHAHHVVGNKWTNIAKILGNGRSPNSIKNRWHSSLKNRLGEHGGESAVMQATGAATGCQCECKHCDCSCKVACIAFRCQCCFAAHHPNVSEPSDEAQIISASTATDDESVASSSSLNTPPSVPSSTSSTSVSTSTTASAPSSSSSVPPSSSSTKKK